MSPGSQVVKRAIPLADGHLDGLSASRSRFMTSRRQASANQLLEETSESRVRPSLLARLGLGTCIAYCASDGSLEVGWDGGGIFLAGILVVHINEVAYAAIYLNCPRSAARRAVPELNVAAGGHGN